MYRGCVTFFLLVFRNWPNIPLAGYPGGVYLITQLCGFDCGVNFRIRDTTWSLGSAHSTPRSMCLCIQDCFITKGCDNFWGRIYIYLFIFCMFIYLCIFVAVIFDMLLAACMICDLLRMSVVCV